MAVVMKKNESRTISLVRTTLRQLTAEALGEARGGFGSAAMLTYAYTYQTGGEADTCTDKEILDPDCP
jgi:hypothetical protein